MFRDRWFMTSIKQNVGQRPLFSSRLIYNTIFGFFWDLTQRIYNGNVIFMLLVHIEGLDGLVLWFWCYQTVIITMSEGEV